MDSAAVAEAAQRLAKNRTDGTALSALPEVCRPGTEDEAYTVQDAMNALLTRTALGAIAGWKIGCTTAVMQRYLGIDHPGAGMVLAATVHPSPARLRHGDFVTIGVEGEIAVRLGADLPPAGAPFDRAAVGAAVGDCLTAIELVDARYVDYRRLDTWTMVADNFFNAGCVLGPNAPQWRDLDLTQATATMTVNDKTVGEGTGAAVMGHPFESVAWLANTLARRGRSLRAGEIVLTGSIVETQWLAAGDSLHFEVEGLGAVAATFD